MAIEQRRTNKQNITWKLLRDVLFSRLVRGVGVMTVVLTWPDTCPNGTKMGANNRAQRCKVVQKDDMRL